MTTAARPTFEPARGGGGRNEKDLGALSKQYSSRDLPGHTKLKYRQPGQGTSDELKSKDFRRELEERERIVTHERDGKKSGRESSSSSSSKRPRLDQVPASNLDADDSIDEEEDSDDSEEDDTAELMAELNRIKKERAQEEAKREAERKVQEERIRMENILSGNPLLNSTKAEFKVKRRWDDDVVFKNCAKGDLEGSKERHFINDTLRSEFHKKFMEKYIK
ncbi:spliceosome-associated protein CWC15 homolog [Ixodes scapularis]|uniref:Pre-mrna-splicing factor cwc15 n=1 Tax=Ixodes ricinus TaxID=34613 RepID=A0A0K8RHQ1_IXORI|nr:spliceosome-associated protein CWC15 homolog [Ixodes scapularis]XP_042149790.1 spliceosome-associated protein CWC15 homolog [Ixodes scapularis]